jgi:AAHS family 4-hydroxybenzoate transporter-like MFS transporter
MSTGIVMTGHAPRVLRTTLLCGLVLVLEGYDLTVVGYVVPQLVDAWGKPPAAFATALTAGNVGMFIGALLCGWLGDRYGRKPVLLGCLTGFGAASLITSFAATTSHLTLARLGTGIGLGGGIPICIALVSDVSPREHQGTLVIAMITGVVVGNLAAGIVAAQMLPSFGWPSVFIVGGAAPLLLLPFVAAFLQESWSVEAPSVPSPISATKAAPTVNRMTALFARGLAAPTILLWAINFLNLLTVFFVNAWLPLMLRSMGASTETAIRAASMFYVGAIVAAVLSGALVGRYGIERVVAAMLAFGGSCIMIAAAVTMSIGSVAAFILGFGFGTGGWQLGISALAGALYPVAIRATGAGWATGVGRLGNVAGAAIGGVLISFGWSAREMLLALSAVPLVNATLMMALQRLRAQRARYL